MRGMPGHRVGVSTVARQTRSGRHTWFLRRAGRADEEEQALGILGFDRGDQNGAGCLERRAAT